VFKKISKHLAQQIVKGEVGSYALTCASCQSVSYKELAQILIEIAEELNK
jgi:hypothetical protein